MLFIGQVVTSKIAPRPAATWRFVNLHILITHYDNGLPFVDEDGHTDILVELTTLVKNGTYRDNGQALWCLSGEVDNKIYNFERGASVSVEADEQLCVLYTKAGGDYLVPFKGAKRNLYKFRNGKLV